MITSNIIYHGDATTLIQQLDDVSIDMIIADIPYYGIVDDPWDNQWSSIEDYIEWLDPLFEHFSRVMKNDTACYVYSSISNYPYVQLCLNRHLTYSATITWKKQRSRGNGWGFNREEICVNVKGHHQFEDVETATLMLPHLRKGSIDYSNGRKRPRMRDYKLATAVWDDVAQVCSYRKQLHPTEKPVENARRMLKASSQRNDLVLIPFVGSGSEIEACLRLDRRYIGFELSDDYCKIATDRINTLEKWGATVAQAA